MPRELRWTDWSEDHIARHGVTAEEVEEAVYARPRWTTQGRNNTLLIFGTTSSGRHLVIVLANDSDGPTAFVVTARDMTSKERVTFRRKGR